MYSNYPSTSVPAGRSRGRSDQGLSNAAVAELYRSLTEAHSLRSEKSRQATIQAASRNQLIFPVSPPTKMAGSGAAAASRLAQPKQRFMLRDTDPEWDAKSNDSADELEHDVPGSFQRACSYGRRTIFGDAEFHRSARNRNHSSNRRQAGPDPDTLAWKQRLADARGMSLSARTQSKSRSQRKKKRDLSQPMASFSLKDVAMYSRVAGRSATRKKNADSESAREHQEQRAQRSLRAEERMGTVAHEASMLATLTSDNDLPNMTPAMLRRIGLVRSKGVAGVSDLTAARLAVAQYIYTNGPKPVPAPKVKPLTEPVDATTRRRQLASRVATRSSSRPRPRVNEGDMDADALYEAWALYAQQHGIMVDGRPRTGATGFSPPSSADSGFGAYSPPGFVQRQPVPNARPARDNAGAPPTPKAVGSAVKAAPGARAPRNPHAKGTLTLRLNDIQGLVDLMGDGTAVADVFVCGKRVASQALRRGADPDRDADGAMDPSNVNSTITVPLDAGEMRDDDALEIFINAVAEHGDAEGEEETLGAMRIPLSALLLQGKDKAAKKLQEERQASKRPRFAAQSSGLASPSQADAAAAWRANSPDSEAHAYRQPQAPQAPPRTLFAKLSEHGGRPQAHKGAHGVMLQQMHPGTEAHDAVKDAHAFDVTPVLASRHARADVYDTAAHAADAARSGRQGGAGCIGGVTVRTDYAPVLDAAAVRVLGRLMGELEDVCGEVTTQARREGKGDDVDLRSHPRVRGVLARMLQKMDEHSSAGGELGSDGVVLTVMPSVGSNGRAESAAPALVEVRTQGADGRVVVRGTAGGYSGHWSGQKESTHKAAADQHGAGGDRVQLHVPLSELLGDGFSGDRSGDAALDVLVRAADGTKVGHVALEHAVDVAVQGLVAALLEHQEEGSDAAGALGLTDATSGVLRRFVGQPGKPTAIGHVPDTVSVRDSAPMSRSGEGPDGRPGTPGVDSTKYWGRMHETQVEGTVGPMPTNTAGVAASLNGRDSIITAAEIESGIGRPLLRSHVEYTALTGSTARALQPGGSEDEVVGTLQLSLDKDSLHVLAPDATAIAVRIAGDTVAVELPERQLDEYGNSIPGSVTKLDIEITAGVLHDLGISTEQVAVTTTAAAPVVLDLVTAQGKVLARSALGSAVPTIAAGTAAALNASGVAPNHYTNRLKGMMLEGGATMFQRDDGSQSPGARQRRELVERSQRLSGMSAARGGSPTGDGQRRRSIFAQATQTSGGESSSTAKGAHGVMLQQMHPGTEAHDAVKDAHAFDVTPVLASRHARADVYDTAAHAADAARSGRQGGAGCIGGVTVRTDYAPVLDSDAVRVLGRLMGELEDVCGEVTTQARREGKGDDVDLRSHPRVRGVLARMLQKMDEHSSAGGELGSDGVVLTVMPSVGSNGRAESAAPALVEVRTQGADGRVVVRGTAGGYSGHWSGQKESTHKAAADQHGAGGDRVQLHVPLSELLGDGFSGDRSGDAALDVLVRAADGTKVGHVALEHAVDVAVQGLVAALLEHQEEGSDAAGALGLTDATSGVLRRFVGQPGKPTAIGHVPDTVSVRDSAPMSRSGEGPDGRPGTPGVDSTKYWGRMHETQVEGTVGPMPTNTAGVAASLNGRDSIITAAEIESGIGRPLLRSHVEYTALTGSTARALQPGGSEDEVVGTLQLSLDKDSLHVLAPGAKSIALRIAGDTVAVELPERQLDEYGNSIPGSVTKLDIEVTAGVLRDLGISSDQLKAGGKPGQPIVLDLTDGTGKVLARTALGSAVPTIAAGTAAALNASGVAPNRATNKLKQELPDSGAIVFNKPPASAPAAGQRAPSAWSDSGSRNSSRAQSRSTVDVATSPRHPGDRSRGGMAPAPPARVRLTQDDATVQLDDREYSMKDPESHVLDSGLRMNLGVTWQPDVEDLQDVIEQEERDAGRDGAPSKAGGTTSDRSFTPGDPRGGDDLGGTSNSFYAPQGGKHMSASRIAAGYDGAGSISMPAPQTSPGYDSSAPPSSARGAGRAPYGSKPVHIPGTAPLAHTFAKRDGFSQIDFHQGKCSRKPQPGRGERDTSPLRMHHDVNSMDSWFNKQQIAALPSAQQMDRSAVQVQRVWRGHQGRNEAQQAQKELDAAITIQAGARGMFARNEFAQLQLEQAEREKEAAALLTRVGRGHIARKEAQHRREDNAAGMIQRNFKGKLAREEVEKRRQERAAMLEQQRKEHEGAVALQSLFRGRTARRETARMRKQKECDDAWATTQAVVQQLDKARAEAEAEGKDGSESKGDSGAGRDSRGDTPGVFEYREHEKVVISPYHEDVVSHAAKRVTPAQCQALNEAPVQPADNVYALAAMCALLGITQPSLDKARALLESGELSERMAATRPYEIPDARRQAALSILRLDPQHSANVKQISRFPVDAVRAVPPQAPSKQSDDLEDSMGGAVGLEPPSPGTTPGGADSEEPEDAIANLIGTAEEADTDALVHRAMPAIRGWSLAMALWRPGGSVEERAAARIQARVRARAKRRLLAKQKNPHGIEVIAVTETGSDSEEETASQASLREVKVSQEAIDAVSGQVMQLSTEQITELVETKKPTQDMVVVAGALCVLLNVPKPSWNTAKKVIRKRGFLKKLSMVHPSLLEDKSRRIARRVLRKHPDHAAAIADVKGMVRTASQSSGLVNKASMADMYGGLKDKKRQRLRQAASMAVMKNRPLGGSIEPIPEDEEGAQPNATGLSASQSATVLPGRVNTANAAQMLRVDSLNAMSPSKIGDAFKGGPADGATEEELAAAGVNVEALRVLHRWCILMSWWSPTEKASLATGLNQRVDREVVEYYRSLGYENPEEAAAAAAIAAAAEVAEGKQVANVFKKQGQYVNPEHLDHYARHFKRVELERKHSMRSGASSRSLRSLAKSVQATIRAGGRAGESTEMDGMDAAPEYDEEEVMATRANTPDEPVLTLAEARQALAALDPADISALQRVDPGAPSMAAISSALCILMHKEPSWGSVREMLSDPQQLQADLVAIKQGNVSERMRYVMATLLGSRRMHGMSRSRERSSGSVLAVFARWLIALLSDSAMSLADVPLPRSARMSAVQFQYVSLEERKMKRMASYREGKKKTSDSASDGERSHSGASERGPVNKFPDNALGKMIRFVEHFDPTKEGVAAMTARAVFRSLAWRAKMRLRQWQDARMLAELDMKLPLGRSRRGLLDLTRHDINTFRRQRPVTQESVIIAGAICVLLGVKPSWKYTRKVLEEKDIMQFFVKLQSDQIDDDTRSVVRGLLLEHGNDLPKLVLESPFLLVKRFHAWFMAFTEGVQPARDAASRAASRPSSSAANLHDGEEGGTQPPVDTGAAAASGGGSAMSPGVLSPVPKGGEGNLGGVPEYAFASYASPEPATAGAQSIDPDPSTKKRSSSRKSSRSKSRSGSRSKSRGDSRGESRGETAATSITTDAEASGRSSSRSKKSKKSKKSRSQTPGADSAAGSATPDTATARSMSPAKKSKKSKKRSKSRSSSRPKE